MVGTEELYRQPPHQMWRDNTEAYMENKIKTSETLIALENLKLPEFRDMSFITEHINAIKFWRNLLDKEY